MRISPPTVVLAIAAAGASAATGLVGNGLLPSLQVGLDFTHRISTPDILFAMTPHRQPHEMDVITLFGACAVTAMLIFYALEHRARAFILCFAVACIASSVYGFLQGAWPFGIVEAIWSVVAFQRWRRAVDQA